MKQLLVKKGQVLVEEVPSPKVSPKNILVKVSHSCISPGTEMTTVKGSGVPLYKRLIKKPEYIKKVYDMVKEKGLNKVKSLVKGKISASEAIGYSASGIVLEIGEKVTGISVGDHVACAGGGYAYHSETIDVPVNLVVKLEKDMDLGLASTVTLGAIALQGVRRTKPMLGEVILVFGLGVLGQITTQLLKNNGCRVIGIDLDQARIDQALRNGLDVGINPKKFDAVDRVLKYTDNFGVDAVIISAAASGDNIIDQSMKMCRKKGRVVLVGAVSLNFSREDFYKKEIDFLISTSYGPGRYDSVYEEEGQDYPFPYVRWTENRNMAEYIRLLYQGNIDLKEFVDGRFGVNDAPKVYEDLKSGNLKSMLVVLNYDTESQLDDSSKHRQFLNVRRKPINGTIKIGVIGSGGFAQSTHLPNLMLLKDKFDIHTVMSRKGANAVAVGKQFDALHAVTDYKSVLTNEDIDLVMICTRHHLHGGMVLEALESGKHVFVEKPLAMNSFELKEVQNFYQKKHNSLPLLMTGFNRRFSKAAVVMKKLVSQSTTPLIVNYKMNAGFIPKDVWVHGPEGGGRNIGEACHIYDLFNFLTGSSCDSITVQYATPKGEQWMTNDNFVVSLKYNDGSVCTLTYTSMGDKAYMKESCDVFFDGQILTMNNYKEVVHHNGKGIKSHACSGKGHLEELQSLYDGLSSNSSWPISLEDQITATEISFQVEAAIKNQ